MADQTVIQVRVDNELKEQVAEIYDRIGIDIPTAVRMFFKATVREDDLPFTTKGKTAEQKEPTQAEKLMEYVKGIMMYEPPLASDENTIVVLPLENGYRLPCMRSLWISFLPERSPAGRTSSPSWESSTTRKSATRIGLSPGLTRRTDPSHTGALYQSKASWVMEGAAARRHRKSS